MQIESESFPDKAVEALDDQILQNALNNIKYGFVEARRAAIEERPDFEALRDHARSIRLHTLERLGEYLRQFEGRVQASGGQVHWARDGAEAREVIANICADQGARQIAKSKSMVSEEIELTPHLEAAGLRVTETDLGEYIVQLRQERPSHIIAPVIHLSKDQVADTFQEQHQQYGFTERQTDRAKLVAEARQVLRRRFLEADVGITGANFLVAETGSAVVVTNEGNADLGASLPKTHIVVTGIEKIVPTLEDTQTLLRVLVRSATGQPTTSYVSYFTGAKRPKDPSGPTNFHVVLVDNGRSKLAGTDFHEMLACIRCGACLNHCPIYVNVGGHAYGSVYSGPMGAVLTPAFAGIEGAVHLPNASTLCGRCEDVCPVRIPLPKMLRHWREREFEMGLPASSVRWGLGIWGIIATHPIFYSFTLRMSGWVMRRLAKRGWITRLPMAASGWTLGRDMRIPSGPTFQQRRKRATLK